MKFAGNEAKNNATGWEIRASHGLNPIATPIGVQTSDAKISRTTTRSSVSAPSPMT
jgi:hypothetical protein